MDLKEKLDKEIIQQTRNGRDSVYIEVKDLEELGINTDIKEGRAFVDLTTLQLALKKYEFKNNLKVDTEYTKPEFIHTKEIEQRQPDKSWDEIQK